jgi:HlyD family secretion protein
MKIRRFYSISASLIFLWILLNSCGAREIFLEASGILEAEQIRVPSRSAGIVLEVPAREGHQVTAGDILAVLDDEAIRLQRDQARAGRDIAAASLSLVLEGARPEDLDQAREALATADERWRLARDEASRLRALVDSGSVSRQDFDRVVSAETQAAGARAQAASALAKLESGARESEIAGARAALAQAEASLALAERALADTRILSPISGTVLYRLVEPGEWAAPGMPVMVVADTENLQLTVYIPEPDLVSVRLGQSAEIRMDGSDRVLVGQISWISPVAEFTPKNIQIREERVKQVFALRIDVTNTDGILKPGMPADARMIPVGEK